MKYSIGVDIGGTNIRLAVVDENGNIVVVHKQRTKKMNCPSDLVDQIEELYNLVGAKNYDVVGMGVGVPGPVQQKTGFVYVLSNIGLNYFNLSEIGLVCRFFQDLLQGEGLRIATDKLDSKNFYAFNPSFDKQCNKKM